MTTIGLIFGGRSNEHEVSLASARGILDNLDSTKYQIRQFGIEKNGNWIVGKDAWNFLFLNADKKLIPPVSYYSWNNDNANFSIEGKIPSAKAFDGIDVLFPVIHGRYGEDGCLQGLCTLLDLPVVGCGVSASAISYDKVFAKAVLAQSGMDTIRSMTLANKEDADNVVCAYFSNMDLFIKPRCGGSSFGISHIKRREELMPALELALSYDQQVLVEEYMEHVELVVGVMETHEGHLVSQPGQCSPVGNLYTYEEKYCLGNPNFKCPADISTQVKKKVMDLALEAFKILRCSGFARIDFFYNKSTGRIVMNEVNTIPGLTQSSVFPKLYQEMGISYSELLNYLIGSSRRL